MGYALLGKHRQSCKIVVVKLDAEWTMPWPAVLQAWTHIHKQVLRLSGLLGIPAGVNLHDSNSSFHWKVGRQQKGSLPHHLGIWPSFDTQSYPAQDQQLHGARGHNPCCPSSCKPIKLKQQLLDTKKCQVRAQLYRDWVHYKQQDWLHTTLHKGVDHKHGLELRCNACWRHGLFTSRPCKSWLVCHLCQAQWCLTSSQMHLLHPLWGSELLARAPRTPGLGLKHDPSSCATPTGWSLQYADKI